MDTNESASDIEAELLFIHERTANIRAHLENKAQACVQDYWDFHWQNNPEMDVDNKSRMGVRVFRKNAETPYFSILWYWNKYIIDNKGKRHTFSNHIHKGRTKLTYARQTLLKHARDWEADVIVEVESRCADIRRQLQDLNKAEAALKRMLKHSLDASSRQASESNDDGAPERGDSPNA